MVRQKKAKKTKAAKNDTASKPQPSRALLERLRRKGYKSDLPGVETRDKVEWHTLLRETLPDALPQTKQRQPVLVGGTTIEKIIESANAFAEAPRAPPSMPEIQRRAPPRRLPGPCRTRRKALPRTPGIR